MSLSPTQGVALDNMGEGVSSALSLIVELADASGRLFLIEEPENDLHPLALRALLDVILDAVPENQFIVSTHSDLVLRQLGSAEGSKIYGVSLDAARIPTSSFSLIETQEQRLDLLAELGYEPELPAGWLILEESTAERVCNQVLIPMFAPQLSGLRTISSRGTSKIASLFADLERLVLFGHLSERYKRKTWVIVDGDESGITVVSALRDKFPGWAPDHFITLSEPSFENYYPPRFQNRAQAALAATNWARQRELKGALAEAVCAWSLSDPEAARRELAESAKEVIGVLTTIARGLVDA